MGRILIDNKLRILGNRRYCLDCSPFNERNTKKPPSTNPDKICVCTICNKEYKYYRNYGDDTLTRCSSCKGIERRKKKKQIMVDYAGGKCQKCGYNKCNKALDFHHINSKEKEFGISSRYNWAWEKIKKEIDKCILVCRNCHAEIHSGLIVP